MTRFLLCTLACLLCACGGPTDPAAQPDTEPGDGGDDVVPGDWKAALQPETDAWKRVEQHLRINNDTEPATLDPQLSKSVSDGRIALALFEGLVSCDPRDLSIRPGVAERWEISDDHLTYTFHLREEARWSDGEPLVAAHFHTAWRRALDPALGAEYAYQLFPVAGAREFYTGESDDPASIGITAPDEHTFVVSLHQPCPWFLEICAFNTLYPVRVDVIEQHGDRWTRPGKLVGNGPFVLESWQPRQALTVVKNPHYWDADYVKLETITFFPYDEAEAALRQYESGTIDWLTSVPQERVDQLQQRSDYFVAPYMGTYFYRFNCSRPPFDDARVRKAFSLAVDREAITRDITRAGEIPATWFCPPVAGYQHVDGLEGDLARARELLHQAGYAVPGRDGGKPFPEVELWFNTSDNHKRVAEVITDRWKRELGVTVLLRNSDWKSYLARMDSLNYDIARSGWIGDYNDPNTFFDLFVENGGNNRTGWSSERYDEMLEESQRILDQEKRMLIFQAMERILVEDELPILPIYIYVTKGMLRETIRGVYFNVRDFHPYQYIWLEDS